ncbi:MAG: two-component sensor histidine kinase [Nitrospirales bacterium]|nr:MAG: two-component sensor histidine kinase [Nitrospirales bacterium]
MPSFRTRIRWSSLSLITILLLTFAVSLYSTLSFLLHRHIDAQLLATVERQAHQVKQETGEIEEILQKNSHQVKDDDDHLEKEDHELREAIRNSVVLSREGTVQWKGEGVGVVARLDSLLLKQVLQGQTTYETLPRSQSSPVRRISLPISSQGQVDYILQTQASLDLVNETLHWLIVTLGIATIGIFVFGWVGSNWVARMALVPVEALGKTTATVSAQSLESRVFLDAPYHEFQQLANSFNSMFERLQKAFESQRRFVGDAAHELRTPLTAMKGNIEVALQRDRSNEEYQDVLATSLGQVEHLARLVKALLTLTKFAGEHPPIELKPILMEPLIKDLVSELSILAEEKGCCLTALLQEVPLILGDVGQLKQLVINLLDNAIRHTSHGGAVTVGLTSSDDRVCLTVTDTGSGIPAEHLPRLFERFYRADQARDRESGGTGLGLAIVQEIVLAHHATIHVKSEVGKGSVFTVSFPVH